MMHRCNVGSCSCGQNGSSFSMMFEGDHMDAVYSSGDHMYSSFTSSSSSVDCTLSLGTPSTRVSNENERRRSSFGWNVAAPPPSSRNHRGGGGSSARSGSSNANSSSGDPLLARRCANCDTTSTPLWRNGPRGPKSLCNACGIRFKKEERRATAANGGATSQGGGGGGGVAVVDSSWIHHHNSCYSSPYGNEFRFIEDQDDHTDNAFLSWRFNVQDRPSLVHDFTR